jgi:hypothetical protein
MTGEEFFDALVRYFFADDLDAASRARLFEAAIALVEDGARRAGQVGLFRPDDPLGHGLAWWEERQRGAPVLRMPIEDLDHALMLLCSDPTLDPQPAPRPHCPAELRGRWELVGVSADGVTVAAPPAPRAWTLGPDGAFAVEGDPERAETGWSWRVHEGSFRSLCLGPAWDPLWERWTLRAQRSDVEMDLVPPEAIRGFERWRRR